MTVALPKHVHGLPAGTRTCPRGLPGTLHSSHYHQRLLSKVIGHWKRHVDHACTSHTSRESEKLVRTLITIRLTNPCTWNKEVGLRRHHGKSAAHHHHHGVENTGPAIPHERSFAATTRCESTHSRQRQGLSLYLCEALSLSSSSAPPRRTTHQASCFVYRWSTGLT